jgi:site-specific DNA-methyltransferase (adenine-specific)/modification methylase
MSFEYKLKKDKNMRKDIRNKLRLEIEQKYNAKIMADGSIKYKENEGSIHKVAAKILGAESCNGWTYWHYNIEGSILPIDNLRQKLFSKNSF